MDKVVQKNAASAEESASASEEMSAQAEQMKRFVGELISLVGGAKGKVSTEPASMNGRRKFASQQLPEQSTHPEQVIPMEEDPFKDF